MQLLPKHCDPTFDDMDLVVVVKSIGERKRSFDSEEFRSHASVAECYDADGRPRAS